MEIILYIALPVATFFGLTAMPIRWAVVLFAGNSTVLNFFPIIAAFFIWTGIDVFYISFVGEPIPIALFLICWATRLTEDYMIKKANWQIHVHMAEAWVIFVWAILAMFGDYRAWY
jgi:hypothetical protein